MAGNTREKLMEEALKIRTIFPERDIDEIYSSLENFSDDPKRVHRVTLMFLDHLKEDDTADDAVEELLSKRSTERNYCDEHNEPSTSGIPRKEPSKSPAPRLDGNRSDDVVLERNLPIDLTQDHLKEDDTADDAVEELLSKRSRKRNYSDEPNEPSTSGIPRKKPCKSPAPRLDGNRSDDIVPERNLSVYLALPGPSTANFEDLLAPPPPRLCDSDDVCIDVNAVNVEKELAYYNSLIEVFPDADKDFVKTLCNKCSQDANWLRHTITDFLENGYPKAAENNEQKQEDVSNDKHCEREEQIKKIIIEENYNNLLAIFPNADPTYIREACERIADDENAMKNFVSETLESRKYPTLAEYRERLKIREMREKYLKNFKIEHFLEIFPDPFKYFFEEKKNNHYDLSLNYLKSRYRNISVKRLRTYLRKNNYSLTKSCVELDKCQLFMKSIRGEHEIQYSEQDVKNIQFMQEVAFVENKEKIEAYLNERKLKRDASFKRAKENNELLECGCCYDDEVLAEDVVTCAEGHIFCRSCLQKYAETQIGEGRNVFTCLSNCDAEFCLKTLQGVLKPSVFSKMLQRKQMEEVKSADIPGLHTCPFCDFASIPPEGDKVFRCLNPECMKESCRECNEENHIPLRCEEVEKAEDVKIRTAIENQKTEELVRTCWRCQKKFIKVSGCNKMTCTCGALMCYICRKPIRGYDHFDGEGGRGRQKCPLFS